MATLTNKSDVVSNFVRYYGRQPSSAADLATVQYLTTKSPSEVESSLAKNSPITKGKLWSEYQSPNDVQTKTTPSRVTPVAIPNPSVIKDYNVTGTSADGKTLMGTPKLNLNQGITQNNPDSPVNHPIDNSAQLALDKQINDYIDSLGVSDEYKQILRTVAKDQYTTGVTIKSSDDIDKIIKNATVNAEASLTPYYDKVNTQNIEDLKKSMGDIRREASNYLATEKLSYSDLLDKTRKSLRARGLTFSGEMRKTLGAEGAINSQGVEGTQPMDRRLGVESAMGKYQSTAADTGTKYERILGSGNQDINNLGTIDNPYATGTTYTSGATTNLYQPLGTTTVGSAQLEREKAIEERKQANLRALTQQ